MSTSFASASGALAAMLALTTTAAAAQQAPAEESQAPNGVADIVVTANRRVENLQRVPVAVTAFSQASLDRLQVTSVVDLNRTAPNLVVSGGPASPSAPGILIRGIGLIDSTWNAESGVGLYVDDVYIPGQPGTGFNLLDVERIEVLRGPQGTLYGRNSTSGAIKVVVRQPTLDTTRLVADATIGSRDRFDARASVSTPLARDTLGVRLDAVFRSQDGYVYDRTRDLNGDDLKRTEFRGALLWKPVANFNAYLVGGYNRERGGMGVSTPGRYDFVAHRNVPIFGVNVTESGTGFRNVNDLDGYSGNLQLEWDTGWGQVKSITAYQDSTTDLGGDFDGLAQGIPFPDSSGFINIDFDQKFDNKLFTQELQYQHKWGNLDVVAGIFYYNGKIKQDTWTRLFFPTGMRQVAFQRAVSHAAYLDLTFDVTDRLQLFGGLRWTTERKTVDHLGALATVTGIQTPFVLSPFPGGTLFDIRNLRKRWSAVTTRVGARYEFTDGISIYVSRSDGFKPGQIQSGRGPDPIASGTFTAKETSATYEVGLRTKLFDNSLIFNATGYYQAYDNLQTGAITNANVITTNTDVNIYGVELESTYSMPLRGLQLNASYSLNRSDFKLPGLVLKDAPDQIAQVGLSYEGKLSGQVSGGFSSSYYWQDDIYFSNVIRNETRLQRAYGVVDAQLFIKSSDDRWKLTGQVRNLFNRRFAINRNEIFGLPATVLPNPYTFTYYNPGRQWSLVLQYRY
jgi:iron complex outermembrane receptor protein